MTFMLVDPCDVDLHNIASFHVILADLGIFGESLKRTNRHWRHVPQAFSDDLAAKCHVLSVLKSNILLEVLQFA